MVVVEGLKPTLAGVGARACPGRGAGAGDAALLFGVSQHDPGTFLWVAGLVLAVGASRDDASGLSRDAGGPGDHASRRIGGLSPG